MADKAPKPGTTKPAKKAPAYEMVVNESGVMRRVPLGTTAAVPPAEPAAVVVAPPPAPSSAAATFRPAIASAALAAAGAPAPAPAEEEEELVFGNTGEVLTGEARAKALAEMGAAPAPAAPPDEEELVFGNTGEILTGEAKAKAQAEAAAAARAVEEAEAKAKAEAETKKQPRKKAEFFRIQEVFQGADEVEKMKLFYRWRGKDTKFFKYTAEGNLMIQAQNPMGAPPGTIILRAFSELRPEELEEIERLQDEKVAELETQYVLKMKELREAYQNYVPESIENTKAIVTLNEQLREISVARNKARYNEQWVKQVNNPTTSEILFSQPHEDRKLGYDAFLFKRFALSRKDAEGHYRQHGEVLVGGGEDGKTVVLFITNVDDQQTGHFHPAFEREFVYNETKYASPYQAYETERFKEFEDEGMVKKLLGTRSAKTIHTLVSQEKQQPQFPVKLWEEILEAVYSQFKDAAEKLKATGSARFHMMDKVIGTPEYAVALANVRTKLKEHENDAPANVDAVKQSVITKEQQQKDKVGAIINNFRRFT